MKNRLGPVYYGHVAGRQYNRGDLVILEDRIKSSNDTDVTVRTIWMCTKGHLSPNDSMEKGCWALSHKEELEAD